MKAVHQTHVLAVIQHVQELIPELVDKHGRPDEAAIAKLNYFLALCCLCGIFSYVCYLKCNITLQVVQKFGY